MPRFSSAGEVLALPPGRIRFAIFTQSGTGRPISRVTTG